MHRRKWSLLLGTALVSAALVVACGDDDDNPVGPQTGTDAGDSGGNKTDTGSSSGDTGTSSGDTGTVDGGCIFAEFVTNLVNTQTASNNAPSTDLGEACKDNQDQKEFDPLFK